MLECIRHTHTNTLCPKISFAMHLKVCWNTCEGWRNNVMHNATVNGYIVVDQQNGSNMKKHTMPYAFLLNLLQKNGKHEQILYTHLNNIHIFRSLTHLEHIHLQTRQGRSMMNANQTDFLQCLAKTVIWVHIRCIKCRYYEYSCVLAFACVVVWWLMFHLHRLNHASELTSCSAWNGLATVQCCWRLHTKNTLRNG